MPSAHRPHCGGASCPPEVKPIVTAVSTVGRSLLSVVAKWAGHEQPTGKIVPVHKRGNPWVEVPFHRPAMQQCASILSYSVMLRIRVLLVPTGISRTLSVPQNALRCRSRKSGCSSSTGAASVQFSLHFCLLALPPPTTTRQAR